MTGKEKVPRYDLTPQWFDWVAVDRALRGVPVGRSLSLTEKRAVITELRAKGLSDDSIAKRMNSAWVTIRSVMGEL